MKTCTGIVCALLIVAGCALVAAQEASAAKPKKGPSAEEIARIADAVSKIKPAARPARPRKLLVYSVSWGYFHSSIPYGKEAFRIMGSETGAFKATVSDDPSMFEPETLRTFDAVFFNNTNRDIFLPQDFKNLPPEKKKAAAERDERLKRSLSIFLAGGRGLAVIHAGVASFREWPEYGEIIGARFDNHPWGAGSEVTLKIEEPHHPLTQAFKDPRFVVKDEIYQLKAPYARDKVRVLLSIDTQRTDMKKGGIHRTDGDFAITYIKPYGKGRVFYNALGHMHELFWNPTVLQHWLDGIQFVLGDLKADAAPRPKTP